MVMSKKGEQAKKGQVINCKKTRKQGKSMPTGRSECRKSYTGFYNGKKNLKKYFRNKIQSTKKSALIPIFRLEWPNKNGPKVITRTARNRKSNKVKQENFSQKQI